MKAIFVFLFLAISVLAFTQNFEKVDQNAINAPSGVQNNVEKLTNYLIKPADTDVEKVRAFYVWIANNIAYDVKLFFSSVIPTEEITANDVLKSRKSVCQGYSELFLSMCEIAEIPCFIVSGYSKGYGWNPDREFVSSDHAWNAVKIDGKWKLIDATWGSGYLNEKNKFEKSFKEEFFLTPADVFIYDHLPSNPMWQLLDCPISIEEFKKDSSEIENIIDNKETCFNYEDSISAFEQLNPSEQQLNSALSSYRFNPKLTDEVGFAYMNYAYEKTMVLMSEDAGLSNQEKYDLQAEILELYEISKEFFKKSKSDISKNALQILNGNIKSSKHNLDVFKLILEND
jgi:Transglutaminase-like superfamily